MLRKTGIIAVILAVAFCAMSVSAQGREVLNLNLVLDPDESAQTETYLTVKKPTDVVRVSWIETRGAMSIPDTIPKSASVYFARTPGGGDLSEYTKVDSTLRDLPPLKPLPGSSTVQMRNIRFSPGVNGMSAGEYNCIVAYESGDTTFYSNYFSVMVASEQAPTLIDPKGLLGAKVINELTPTFSWNAVEGVPYYHILLSDEPFPVEEMLDGANISGLNLSIVWQAITPSNRITYGTPDPSNTITAAPPPLSPGKDYMWMVLNNYGNHMAFTDGNAFDLPGMFRIAGAPLTTPKAVSPADGVTVTGVQGGNITFRWTDLDTTANSYLINLFVAANAGSLGMSELDTLDVSAAMLVWETTVSMPREINGRRARPSDTLSAVLRDPLGTLTGTDYVWRVYARDDRGAASTGPASKAAFKFSGLPTGTLKITTAEVVGGVEANVGYVELRSEVISGPTQAPLAFYTNNSGGYTSPLGFPVGVFRLTAVKEGYNNETVTVTVSENDTAEVKIFLRRPDAVIFGRAADSSDGSWLNLARVTAVSEWGDTVTALTNANGNFTLNCREADWTVTVDRAGYRTPRAIAVPLRQGENRNLGTILLPRHTERLSGVVRNTAGEPVLGARVRVLRDGLLVDELASTPQSGAYSFLLPSGTYTLTAEMPGFAMFSRVVNFTGSANQDAVLAPNARVINGAVLGRSWNGAAGRYDVAPITGARVTFFDADDTLTVTSDATFGNFTLSVPGGRRFNVRAEAGGFVSAVLKPVEPAGTDDIYTDTLQAFARIGGTARFRDSVGQYAVIGNVDVIIYDQAGRRAVASAKSSHNGSFEIRNIPDGEYVVNAGMARHYQIGEPPVISVEGGRVFAVEEGGGRQPVNSLDIAVARGTKTITWNVTGEYSGAGVVKVVSPLNRIIPFSSGNPAELDSVGPGVYTVEAVAEDDKSLLQLSNRRFTVAADDRLEHNQNITFPLKHTQQAGGEIALSDDYNCNRCAVFTIGAVSSAVPVPAAGAALIYRSAGNARWDSVYVDHFTSIPADGINIRTAPNTVRDGADLQYYFRVFLTDTDGDGNADIYGSEKQIFTVYVKPSEQYITRLAVTPGVADPLRDTLALPSSYAASFSLGAFYSDLFLPVDTTANFGSIAWSVEPSGAATVSPSNGRRTTVTTHADAGSFTLVARLNTAASSNYTVRPGQETVRVPIRATGSRLASVTVLRSGDAGPITNTERASFRVEGRDSANTLVTVSPVWSVEPTGAGVISGGVFEPARSYFGNARVYASIGEGSGLLREEYYEAGAELPGLSVVYMIRNMSADTVANTYRGLRVTVPDSALLQAGQSAEMRAAVHPEPQNMVRRGGDGFRMADSLSYDIEFVGINRLREDKEFGIAIDIPARLKAEAESNPGGFMIARWYPDSLAWVVLPSSRVENGAVVAVISRGADDITVNGAYRNSAETPAQNKRTARGRRSRAMAKTGAAAQTQAQATPLASQMHRSARYALVVKSNRLTLDVAVSPNPFSPNIKPVKEYGLRMARDEIPYGTCVRVNIDAPEGFVSSLKVHIYNATHQRVWAVEKLNANAGEHLIWWDGYTTVREEVWTPDNKTRNKYRGRMARNGRYFAMVIITDIEGRQRRVMKPVVLMK